MAERLGEAKHCSYIDGMNTENLQLLKDILAVPTKTHNEERLVKFLIDYFEHPDRRIMKGGCECGPDCDCMETDRINDFKIMTKL